MYNRSTFLRHILTLPKHQKITGELSFRSQLTKFSLDFEEAYEMKVGQIIFVSDSEECLKLKVKCASVDEVLLAVMQKKA